MKTKVKHPVPVSQTIQNKSKAANQAPVGKILQRYQDKTIQRQDIDEDELIQGKFDDTTQLMEPDEDEEIPLQGKFEDTAQREEGNSSSPVPTSPINKTGLPDNLKTGIENLSGYSMDDVRVHYNSGKPAQLQALAYTQGTDIHVAPGQEKHLPHEAWHVVQQKQGRVQPTMQLQGVNVNDNEELEREADLSSKNIQNDSYQSNSDIFFMDNILSFSEIYQFRRSKKDKELIQSGNQRLLPLVHQFVGHMLPPDIANFQNLNKTDQRQYIINHFPPFGMRLGDLVEEPGLVHMMKASTSDDQKVLTSVKLHFRQSDGNSFQERGELDGLILDENLHVVKIVSAKINTQQVNPAHDRHLLKPFYEFRKKENAESYTGYAWYLANKFNSTDVNFTQLMNTHYIEGFNIEYHLNGGPSQILNETVFRTTYPLYYDNVDSTPVIGLTPKPQNRADEITSNTREDLTLIRNYNNLLNDFADMIINNI